MERYRATPHAHDSSPLTCEVTIEVNDGSLVTSSSCDQHALYLVPPSELSGPIHLSYVIWELPDGIESERNIWNHMRCEHGLRSMQAARQ